jgi:hypothetical protein
MPAAHPIIDISQPSVIKICRIKRGRAPILPRTAMSSFFSKISMLRELSTLHDIINKMNPRSTKMMIFSVVIIL